MADGPLSSIQQKSGKDGGELSKSESEGNGSNDSNVIFGNGIDIIGGHLQEDDDEKQLVGI